MARTSKSRGRDGFTMRSGNSPLTLFKGLKNVANKIIGATPIAQGINALTGGGDGGGGNADDVNTKIDEIHAALVGSEGSLGNIGEGQTLAKATKSAAALPKKTPFPTNNDNKGVYATVDGAGLTYGEYQTYDKTGRLPSDYKSRIGKNIDLSEIVSKEEQQNIIQPKTNVEDDEPIEGEEGYVG
jgi:hypothetical protein